nr:major coat protein [Citrus tristeza virus]
MDDETKKLKNKTREPKEGDNVVAVDPSYSSVNLPFVPTLITMKDGRQLSPHRNTALNKNLFLTLKGNYPTLPDKNKDFHIPMMLYRLPVKSSSLQSDDDPPGITYTRKGVEVNLPDKLVTDAGYTSKGMGNRTTALQVGVKTNDALYLLFCRRIRILSNGERPLDAGIPAGNHYRCANFWTEADWMDLDGAVYLQAKKQLLKNRGADEVVVTMVRQLGKSNTR